MIKLSGNEMINSASIQKIKVDFVQHCVPNESVSLYVVIDLTLVKGAVITIRNLLHDKIMLACLKHANSFESATSPTGIWLPERYHDELETTLYSKTMSNELVPKIKEMLLGLFNTYMVPTGGHTDSDKMTFEEYLNFLHSQGMSTEYQEFYNATRKLFNIVYETLETTIEKLALKRLQDIHGGKIEDIEEDLNGMSEEERKYVEEETKAYNRLLNEANKNCRTEDEDYDAIFDMSASEYEAKIRREKYIELLNLTSKPNTAKVTTDTTNECKEEEKIYVVFNVFDFKNGTGNNDTDLKSFITYGYNVIVADNNGVANVVGCVSRTVYSGLWFRVFDSNEDRIACDKFYYDIVNNPVEFELGNSNKIKQLLKTLYKQFVFERLPITFSEYCLKVEKSNEIRELVQLLSVQNESVWDKLGSRLKEAGAKGGKND